jgi:hypothetical protein
MVRHAWFLLPVVCVGLGCLGDEKTQLVPDNHFGAPPAPPVQATYAPAATATAARVDGLGRALLAANRQLGLQPMFRTIGSPTTEVFHRGTAEIYITEGLVKQCSTDAHLTALLSLELGKMVSEREVLAGPRSLQASQEPPPDVPVGNDFGFSGAPDQTRLAELAKYPAPARREAPPPPPDPEVLARAFLQKAGYPPAELDAVLPLVRTAAASNTLERQLAPPAKQ